MTDDQWYDLFESVAANLRHANLTKKQQHEELARIVAAERERCAKLCDDEARIRKEAGEQHPEDSERRGRCFAAARAAMNCARSVRSGEAV